MANAKLIQRLIWKDIIAIRSLVYVAAGGVVALNLLLFAIWKIDAGASPVRGDLFAFSVFFWIVIPQLVAVGAPVMLVGNEEESGTLAWLRTLPVRWQHVAGVKFWLALGGSLATWLFATIGFVFLNSIWGRLGSWEVRDSLNFDSVLLIGFYDASLLLVGFAAIYLIRSPVYALISGLVAYAVLMVGITILAHNLGWVVGDEVMPSGFVWGCTFLFVLWVGQQLLARRRLLLPAENIVLHVGTEPPSDYRPPIFRSGAHPTQVASLLWQQIRQAGPLCIVLVAFSTILTFMFSVASVTPLRTDFMQFVRTIGSFSPAWIAVSASWLGAVVFYGDNVHRRCGFFADRGIAPTRIWWTRMIPPAIGCLLLLALIVGSGVAFGFENWPQFMVLSIVLFAFGQLVSQWVDRPLLAFFAAPAYTCVSLSPVFYLLDRFNADFWVILLAAPVLLFASWKLTLPWLEGRIQAGYTARVLAYTGIAVLIPCLWILGAALPSARILVSSQSEHTITTRQQTTTSMTVQTGLMLRTDTEHGEMP